jgi:hypothetical protein
MLRRSGEVLLATMVLVFQKILGVEKKKKGMEGVKLLLVEVCVYYWRVCFGLSLIL